MKREESVENFALKYLALAAVVGVLFFCTGAVFHHLVFHAFTWFNFAAFMSSTVATVGGAVMGMRFLLPKLDELSTYRSRCIGNCNQSKQIPEHFVCSLKESKRCMKLVTPLEVASAKVKAPAPSPRRRPRDRQQN